MELKCKYCNAEPYGTNQAGEVVCVERLNTGKCHQKNKQQPRTVKTLPGRNDKCGCGSGKKFKHCCMQSIRSITA